MKLQNLLLPKTGICTEEKMYFRRNGSVDFTWDRTDILMFRDASISFDTYFNGCSAEKWFKYTKIKKIQIKLRIEGVFRITLMRKEKFMNDDATKFLHEEVFGVSGVENEYTFTFETESNSGMFCFSLLCLSESARIISGYYEGVVEPTDIDFVKLGLVICTFKREAFVTKNIKTLTDEFLNCTESGMSENLEIFISDNAGTLNTDGLLIENKVRVFLNKNTGGAGGFTRGMIEVLNRKDTDHITHVLVMDDDVIINADSIYRTFVILSLLKDEYKDAFVGGAMLRLDKQYIQTEAGARWNKGYLVSHKSGLNLLDVDACLYNEFEEKAEFNAWWYCAFPVNVISEQNLPLPLFIRGDDVEYGLRNMKHLILMNGICVWHEPFENKYASSMYYYILRNRLIDNSIHNMKYKRRDFLKDLFEQVGREILYYRYKNADLLLDGVEDFFKGVDWLKEQDGSVLHKDVMARGYKLQDINELEIPFSYPAYETSCRMEEPKRGKKLLCKLSANGLLLPARKQKDNEIIPVVVPTFTARPVQFYRVKKALNYDYCSRKGFVTQKSMKQTIRLLIRYERIVWKCRFRYRSLVKQYRVRGGELMDLSFWQGYLDI